MSELNLASDRVPGVGPDAGDGPDQAAEPPAHRRRGVRRWTIVTAGVAALVAAAGATAATVTGGPTGSGERRQGPPATVAVQRTTLVDARTFQGTLGYGDPAPLAGRLPGTVTDIAAVGTVLHRGDVAYRVDNQPVVLLIGPLPAFRPLAPGTTGPDVQQFKENLRALGVTGVSVDERYTDATATAVKRWQKKLGLPETGVVDLGRVIYVAQPLRVAERKVAVGDGAPVGAPVLTASTEIRGVTVELDSKDKGLAKVGTKVTVRLPSGTSTEGVMAVVGAAAQNQGGGTGATDSPGGGSNRTRVAVTIADQAAVAGADLGQVTVVVVGGQKKDVRAGPIVALLAVGDGYGVEVVVGTSSRIVPVEIGMFANGRVEIEGADIAEGTLVGVPSP